MDDDNNKASSAVNIKKFLLDTSFLVPFLDGSLITGINFIANADTTISHGLNRTYQGYFIIAKNNFGDIKTSDVTNSMKDQRIVLVSNSSMVASMWFF